MQAEHRWIAIAERAASKLRSLGELGALPPGPPEPAALQTVQWMARPTVFLRRCRDRYGPTFTLRFLGAGPFVSFSEPDAVKEIFTGPADALFAGEANVVLQPLLGDHSVLLLDGAKHMRQRRLLLPPFHGQRMRAYGETIRDATLRSVADWPRGEVFAAHDHTQQITLEVIQRAVFGLDDDGDIARFARTLAELLDQVSNPLLLLPIFRMDLGRYSPGAVLTRRLDALDAMLFGLIRRRRREGREGREDILSMLLDARDEDGEAMTDQELRDELMTLLVAGHETTATSLAWTFHRLLAHPETLERAVAEVRDAFGGGPIDPDGVRELPWLAAVAKETLRLNPVIPAVGRRLQRPMRLGGVNLPAGAIALPNIYLAHRNPRAWREPDRFDPTRFLEDKPSPYAFFPFGGGIRRCIGMAFALYEMQVVLATVLSKVRLRPAPGVRVRVVRRAITFAPSHGMPMVVTDV